MTLIKKLIDLRKVGPEYPGEGAAKISAAGSKSSHPDDLIYKSRRVYC